MDVNAAARAPSTVASASVQAGTVVEKGAAAERYPLTGVIVSVDLAKKVLVVFHDEIKGYMPAMTMEFLVSSGDAAVAKAGKASGAPLSATRTLTPAPASSCVGPRASSAGDAEALTEGDAASVGGGARVAVAHAVSVAVVEGEPVPEGDTASVGVGSALAKALALALSATSGVTEEEEEAAAAAAATAEASIIIIIISSSSSSRVPQCHRTCC